MRPRLWMGAILLGSVIAPGAAPADVTVDITVPAPPSIVLPAPPALVLVPGHPTVRYAPSIDVDLFFFDARWYYWHGGYWYTGKSWKGPWKHVVVEKLPPGIGKVPAKYYKIPPGHAKRLRAPGGPPGPPAKVGPPGHGRGKGKGKH